MNGPFQLMAMLDKFHGICILDLDGLPPLPVLAVPRGITAFLDPFPDQILLICFFKSKSQATIMNYQAIFNRSISGAVFSLCGFCMALAHADAANGASPLAGTWTLVAADVQHPDGSRTHDYGEAPKGLLIVDAQGHYSLQIFKMERLRFASGDKSTGTPEEYKSAVMGSSTHVGTLDVDPGVKSLTFHIQSASFPNWEGTIQKRSYEIKGNELSYRVVPRPNGDVPISVWRRLD